MDERALVSISCRVLPFFPSFPLSSRIRRNCSRDQDGKVPTDNPFFFSFLFLIFNHSGRGHESGVLIIH